MGLWLSLVQVPLRYNLRELCICYLRCLPALSHYRFLYVRDTIFDRMITTFRFSRMTFIVVQFWVLILPNLGRTQDAFDSIRHTSFSHLIMNRLILAV